MKWRKSITIQDVLKEIAREIRFIFTIFLHFVEICYKEYSNERDK